MDACNEAHMCPGYSDSEALSTLPKLQKLRQQDFRSV